jgi:hypothetical protein
MPYTKKQKKRQHARGFNVARDFVVAQKHAKQDYQPIFLYLNKLIFLSQKCAPEIAMSNIPATGKKYSQVRSGFAGKNFQLDFRIFHTQLPKTSQRKSALRISASMPIDFFLSLWYLCAPLK